MPEAILGACEGLARFLSVSEPLTFGAADAPSVAAIELLDRAQAGAAVIAAIPMRGTPAGLLALFGREEDFGADWKDFARGVAAQLGQVITLVRAFGERRAAESALGEVRRRLEHAFASSPAVTYVLRLGGAQPEPIWVSDNIERVLGHPVHDTLDPAWWPEHLHPEDRPGAADLTELLRAREQRRQYRVRDAQGRYRRVVDQQRLVEVEDGGLEVVGTWVDVSDQVEAEEARRASEERHRQVFEVVGTTFRLFLPPVEGSSPPSPEPVPPTARGGSEAVLVVEDERALRELLVEFLTDAGYRVASAGNPEAALALDFAEPPGALVTDVVMPGMNGLGLARQLRQRFGRLPVLFMSGRGDPSSLTSREVVDSGDRLLEKPFSAAALLQAVRSMLDAG